MNIFDIIIGIILIGIIAFAISLVLKKKSGCSMCSGDCSNCKHYCSQKK